MKVVLDIQLDAKHLFKFNMQQAYKGMQGILSIILPILIIIYAVMSFGEVDISYTILYSILAVVFFLYIPISLWTRVKKIMSDSTNALSKMIHYEFEEDQIRVSVEEESAEFKWENIYQMKVVGELLLVYTNRINAYILPLNQVGDKYASLSELAHSKLEKYRIKMK